MWNTAIRKAVLDTRDNNTRRRLLHLHSLRKFFRSNIGLDIGMTNALMGHVEYLDEAYLRLEQEGEMAKAYKEAMPNVSVFNVEDQQLKKQTLALEAENAKLKERIATLELERNGLAGRMNQAEEKLSSIEKLVKQLIEQA